MTKFICNKLGHYKDLKTFKSEEIRAPKIFLHLILSVFCFLHLSGFSQEQHKIEILVINNSEEPIKILGMSPLKYSGSTALLGARSTGNNLHKMVFWSKGLGDENNPDKLQVLYIKVWKDLQGQWPKEEVLLYEEELLEPLTTFEKYGSLIIEVSQDKGGALFMKRSWTNASTLFEKVRERHSQKESSQKPHYSQEFKKETIESSLESEYQILGVSPECTQEEIKKAYRALAFKWHPDTYSGEDQLKAHAAMQKINRAYNAIVDSLQ